MGDLADRAKQQSKFLIIEKGQMAVVRYLDYRIVPSNLDPTKDVVQYRVSEDGREKFWSNGSAAVMRTMDKIKKGVLIGIQRSAWINQKDGTEDKSKSTYTVIEIDESGNPVDRSATAEA